MNSLQSMFSGGLDAVKKAVIGEDPTAKGASFAPPGRAASKDSLRSSGNESSRSQSQSGKLGKSGAAAAGPGKKSGKGKASMQVEKEILLGSAASGTASIVRPGQQKGSASKQGKGRGQRRTAPAVPDGRGQSGIATPASSAGFGPTPASSLRTSDVTATSTSFSSSAMTATSTSGASGSASSSAGDRGSAATVRTQQSFFEQAAGAAGKGRATAPAAQGTAPKAGARVDGGNTANKSDSRRTEKHISSSSSEEKAAEKQERPTTPSAASQAARAYAAKAGKAPPEEGGSSETQRNSSKGKSGKWGNGKGRLSASKPSFAAASDPDDRYASSGFFPDLDDEARKARFVQLMEILTLRSGFLVREGEDLDGPGRRSCDGSREQARTGSFATLVAVGQTCKAAYAAVHGDGYVSRLPLLAPSKQDTSQISGRRGWLREVVIRKHALVKRRQAQAHREAAASPSSRRRRGTLQPASPRGNNRSFGSAVAGCAHVRAQLRPAFWYYLTGADKIAARFCEQVRREHFGLLSRSSRGLKGSVSPFDLGNQSHDQDDPNLNNLPSASEGDTTAEEAESASASLVGGETVTPFSAFHMLLDRAVNFEEQLPGAGAGAARSSSTSAGAEAADDSQSEAPSTSVQDSARSNRVIEGERKRGLLPSQISTCLSPKSSVGPKAVPERELELRSRELGRLNIRKMNEIDRDISRTYPYLKQFSEDDGLGRATLIRVLFAAYILYPQVGYCQGSNFVAGCILVHVS